MKNAARNRVTRAVGIGVGLALVLSACATTTEPEAAEPLGNEEPVEELGDPVRGGEITVAIDTEVDNWLPSDGAISGTALNVGLALYDPLVVVGKDGQYTPYLAESLEANDDLTEWTVGLRPGVTFHDGTRFDAAALRDLFEKYTKKGRTTSGQVSEISKVRVDGPLTATYVLESPNAAFPSVLQGPAGWPFSVKAADAAGDDAGVLPAGTGAFKMESWSRDDRVVVVRNDDYWREGLPYLDKITFRPLPDETTRVDSLLTGGIDAMTSLRGSTIKRVLEADKDGYTAHTAIGADAGVTYFNVLQPPFDDVRLRRAFAHSLGQEDVAKVLGDDGLVPGASQFYNEDSAWFSEKVADARPKYDPEKAASLVASYVNDPNRSDGKPVGTPPSFAYQCLTDPSLLEIAQLIQMEATKVGFDVEIQPLEQAALVANTMGQASDDPPLSGDFSATCFRITTMPDPVATFSQAFGPPETHALNISNFHTPELRYLIDELGLTVEFDERYDLVEQIGVLINEQVPVAFGTNTPEMIGVQDGVKNVTGWTLPDGSAGSGISFGATRWSEVWLEE